MDSFVYDMYQTVQAVGPLVSIFLLLGIIIEKCIERGWIKFSFFGGSDDSAVRSTDTELVALARQILASQKDLRAHYNDETTELLASIAENQKRVVSLCERGNEVMRDGFRSIEIKFNEYDKYGVPSRPIK